MQIFRVHEPHQEERLDRPLAFEELDCVVCSKGRYQTLCVPLQQKQQSVEKTSSFAHTCSKLCHIDIHAHSELAKEQEPTCQSMPHLIPQCTC